jgi:hypothetical protein
MDILTEAKEPETCFPRWGIPCTISLLYEAPSCAMCHSYDASIVWCVPCTMRPLYDASLVRCVPCRMRPRMMCSWDDGSVWWNWWCAPKTMFLSWTNDSFFCLLLFITSLIFRDISSGFFNSFYAVFSTLVSEFFCKSKFSCGKLKIQKIQKSTPP